MFILDSYDGVTAAACFSANHVPCAALHELIRIVKPGELIYLTIYKGVQNINHFMSFFFLFVILKFVAWTLLCVAAKYYNWR